MILSAVLVFLIGLVTLAFVIKNKDYNNKLLISTAALSLLGAITIGIALSFQPVGALFGIWASLLSLGQLILAVIWLNEAKWEGWLYYHSAIHFFATISLGYIGWLSVN